MRLKKNEIKQNQLHSREKTKDGKPLLSEEELDTFLYKISHDLKGPLLSINGLLEIARDEIRDETQARYFDMLGTAVRNMEHTLNGLLDLTRIQTSTETAMINAGEILEEVTKELKEIHTTGFPALKTDVPSGLTFMSRPTLFRIILNQLISNAIQFRARTGKDPVIKITISKNEDEIGLIIEDNGIGIDKEKLDHIFKMFYKGSAYSEGSGLGLFLTEKAVEKMNGSIAVSSHPGKGTTVTVYLPVKS